VVVSFPSNLEPLSSSGFYGINTIHIHPYPSISRIQDEPNFVLSYTTPIPYRHCDVLILFPFNSSFTQERIQGTPLYHKLSWPQPASGPSNFQGTLSRTTYSDQPSSLKPQASRSQVLYVPLKYFLFNACLASIAKQMEIITGIGLDLSAVQRCRWVVGGRW